MHQEESSLRSPFYQHSHMLAEEVVGVITGISAAIATFIATAGAVIFSVADAERCGKDGA